MTQRLPPMHLTFTPAALTIHWRDGRHSAFPALWLADNDPVHRDLHSGQRLIDIADLPEDPLIERARLHDGHVRIEWQGGLPATHIAVAWLARQAASGDTGVPPPRRVWHDGAAMDGRRDCAWLSLAQLQGDPPSAAMWFDRLDADGLAFLAGVPARPGAVIEAAAQVGLVQETNYGRLFDVRSVEKAENLAYTDLGLGLHTDNPYRDPVPGFQALHCIVAAVDGGDSVFADGFAIAGHLREVDPQAFERLASTPVRFAYDATDAALEAERPLIEMGAHDEMVAVHYNNRSIAPLPFAAAALGAYYRAYRRFAELLREPRFHLKLRLGAGELVVFDNWRVLHARTSYRTARHLQGCYLTRDSVRSRSALLRRGLAGDLHTC